MFIEKIQELENVIDSLKKEHHEKYSDLKLKTGKPEKEYKTERDKLLETIEDLQTTEIHRRHSRHSQSQSR